VTVDKLTTESARVIDSRGAACPQPIIDIAKVASTQGSGTRLVLLSDDPATEIDLPAWCGMKGHKFLGRGAGGFYLVELS
jgi:TusA-related sulfurtransferase